jgi:hypothetical protein
MTLQIKLHSTLLPWMLSIVSLSVVMVNVMMYRVVAPLVLRALISTLFVSFSQKSKFVRFNDDNDMRYFKYQTQKHF